jgi:hypothetical protein
VTFAFGGQRSRAPATIDPGGEITLRRIEPGGIDPPKIGAQACVPRLIGITFLGSSQWSIRSAQCCINFVRESINASGPCFL